MQCAVIMGTKKLVQEARQALEQLPGVQVMAISPKRSGHLRVWLTLPDGEMHAFGMSCSPKDWDTTVKALVRDVRRYMRGAYV